MLYLCKSLIFSWTKEFFLYILRFWQLPSFYISSSFPSVCRTHFDIASYECCKKYSIKCLWAEYLVLQKAEGRRWNEKWYNVNVTTKSKLAPGLCAAQRDLSGLSACAHRVALDDVVRAETADTVKSWRSWITWYLCILAQCFKLSCCTWAVPVSSTYSTNFIAFYGTVGSCQHDYAPAPFSSSILISTTLDQGVATSFIISFFWLL